jgi:hypothetical protein
MGFLPPRIRNRLQSLDTDFQHHFTTRFSQEIENTQVDLSRTDCTEGSMIREA